MKKQKNLIFGIIIVLLAVTTILAVLHLTTRTQEQANMLQISYNGEVSFLSLTELPLYDVSGTTVNGKGEENQVKAKGILLSAALAESELGNASVQQVTVKAADEFSAVITAEELAMPDKVYLICEDEEEWPRLVVFGDQDSKRNVRDVVRLEVE